MAASDSRVLTSTSERSPWLYALGGALASLAVVAFVAFVRPQGPDSAAGAAEGGGPGGFGFGPSLVEVVAAVEMVAAEPVQLLGSVSPLREALVASEVEGAVAEVLVDEGDGVKAGQLLARLRTTTVELDLAAARANRAEAAARLVRFEAEVVRMSDLRDRGAVSEREYEQAIADRDAQQQLVSRYEAEAARLHELIARAQIDAPFDGQVSAVYVEVGEWVDRGGDVITLMDLSEVEVTVPIPERYVSQAEVARREGWPIQVRFDALEGEYEGKIRAVVPQANPQARTFPVIVVVDNSDRLIRGGMSARVLAQVGDPVPTVLVPKDALVLRSGRTFVYRVAAPIGAPAESPATAEELAVEIGMGFGAWQAVEADLAAGDLVVVRGNEMLRPGVPVQIAAHLDMEPPPAASADLPVAAPRGDGR